MSAYLKVSACKEKKQKSTFFWVCLVDDTTKTAASRASRCAPFDVFTGGERFQCTFLVCYLNDDCLYEPTKSIEKHCQLNLVCFAIWNLENFFFLKLLSPLFPCLLSLLDSFFFYSLFCLNIKCFLIHFLLCLALVFTFTSVCSICVFDSVVSLNYFFGHP